MALLALTAQAGFDAVAVYVDHGLRPATEHEAALVAEAAAHFGTAFELRRAHVDNGPNLEARARDARYATLASMGAAAIFTGHTRDDQAETVLLHLLRGSGVAGLAGIPRRRANVFRPLLDCRRAETRELCARLGLAVVHDPMNDDLRYRRVWLRREIIPALERVADRDLVDVLARQADLLRDDDELLTTLALEHATDDTATIAAMPAALARRTIRSWLGSRPPSLATVDRVLAVARADARATELPGGDRVERIGGRLVRVPAGDAAPAPVTFQLPGRTEFGVVELEAWIEHTAPATWPDGRWTAVCDADLVPETAVIEAGRRALAPVVAADGPVWRIGYGIDRRIRVSSRTTRYLWLSAQIGNR
jgi:tRNA(Ile)-lysidine synthase